MKIAIMQPYLFPYIGYFQLINAVDKFVFYDDVNFIKRGWINRNKILINGKAHLFSIPLKKASQNKSINEIELAVDQKWLSGFYATLKQNYKKAKYFDVIFSLIEIIFSSNHTIISDFTINSITTLCHYLGISTIFEKSSMKYAFTKELNKEDRLIEITKINNTTEYINPSDGAMLYDKTYFKENGVKLSFIENHIVIYKQFSNSFVGGLSIVDILMFNSKPEIKNMLNKYTII